MTEPVSPPFAVEPARVAERWRALTPEESAVATVRLADAADMLTAQVPQLLERFAAGALTATVIQRVQVDMVLRLLKNPDGHRQGSRSIDDYTEGWTIDNAISAGELYVSDTELALLSPRPSRPRIGTMRLGIGL